ncbi:MAG: hypothetical protein ACLPOO_12825 [Terriglobales bacterium]
MLPRHSFLRLLGTCLLILLFTHVAAYAQLVDHVHHLWYNNSTWQDQDLTALTGGPDAYSVDGVTAFYTTPNQQLHVYYIDYYANHVHQLYYNNSSWSDADLTALTGGPNAHGPIAGFAIGNYQYVFYSGSDSHVHELSYVDNWTDQDVTAQAPGATSGGYVVAFATKPNNQFHVYYEAASAPYDLHQLYFNGTSWSDADLTAITGAYCTSGSIQNAGLATGNLQHILCPGWHGNSPGYVDMLHVYYNNDTWVYEDITQKAGGAELPLWPGAGQAGFAVGKQGEVYSVTDDTHVHQYTYKSGLWSDLDLTATIGAPANSAPDAMVGFTTPNDQFHLYYIPDTNPNEEYVDVYQLYFNGTNWAVDNLTGGSGQADDVGGMAGFAIGNLQHVFYFANPN